MLAPMNRLNHSPLLERLGLHRPELRAWALYDWANSAYITVVITALFPILFARHAGADIGPQAAATRFALASALALGLVAILSPFLGALADRFPIKKRLLGTFLALGVTATAALGLTDMENWGLALFLFVIGNVGAYGSFVFYDALLPHIAPGPELDRVSTAGYAIGYLGGGLLLAVDLAALLKPNGFGLPDTASAVAVVFLSVAVWWLLFSIPLFSRVPEPVLDPVPRGPLLSGTLAQLAATVRELLGYREAALFLLAFLIYNDGIVTIIRMAALYGTEIGLSQGTLIGAILLVQFAGIPFAFLFGAVAGVIGTRRAILVTLGVYVGVAVLGYRMENATHFYLLAFLVATVQGGCQALSRSLFASMIPKARSAEFFSFFAVAEKAASVLGPITFAAAVAVTGSSRAAVLAISLFFVIGAALLLKVDVARGRARVAAG